MSSGTRRTCLTLRRSLRCASMTRYDSGPAIFSTDTPLTRPRRQCNGSDVFGSDICTCRPYLIFGIEEAVKEAQNGGSGVVIYFRKEGRALGEVTKVQENPYPVSEELCEADPTLVPYVARPVVPRLSHALAPFPGAQCVPHLTEICSGIQRQKTRGRSCVGLFQADRKHRRCQGHALSGPDA